MHNIDFDELRRSLRAFRTPSDRRAALECAVTLTPLLMCWSATFALASVSLYAALLLIPVTSVFHIRAFVIQHDCGHGAFFESRRANDALGRVLGVLTFTPYAYWRHSHGLHHANTGNLAGRGFWDVPLLTVREYRAMSFAGRLGYRILRHPLFLFGLAPSLLFIVRHRLPFGLMRDGVKYWVSALGSSLAMAVIAVALGLWLGFDVVAVAVLPVIALSASIGLWLLLVQHYFEDSRIYPGEEWRFAPAAALGSSHYLLPKPLNWITANVGIHHIHHLDSRIPFYRLPDALSAHPELQAVSRLTIRESVYCVTRTLWDEDARRFVSPAGLGNQQTAGAD